MSEHASGRSRGAPPSPAFSLAFAAVCGLLAVFTALVILDGGMSQHPWGIAQSVETSDVAFVQVIGAIAVLLGAVGAFVGTRRWRRRGDTTVPFLLMVVTLTVFFAWLTLAIYFLDPGG